MQRFNVNKFEYYTCERVYRRLVFDVCIEKITSGPPIQQTQLTPTGLIYIYIYI